MLVIVRSAWKTKACSEIGCLTAESGQPGVGLGNAFLGIPEVLDTWFLIFNLLPNCP